MKNLTLLKDACEVVHYDNANHPLYTRYNRLSEYTSMRHLCHWHDDIEMIRVTRGYMNYYVGGEHVTICENDALFVNSKQMHYGYSADNSDCAYISVLFKPQLLCSTPHIKRRYVDTVVQHAALRAYSLHAANPDEAEIIEIFDDIFDTSAQKAPGYELRSISQLNMAWLRWFDLISPRLGVLPTSTDPDVDVQKKMAEFIYQNYQSKISLGDIAKAGGVCRSKCCSIFKNYMNKSPIDFLNAYRLEVSMNLLRDTALTVTEIAFACGFNSASYYAEIFLRYKGCSPGGYRQQQSRGA